MKPPLWTDRQHAGQELALALKPLFTGQTGLILGLPRGGIPVALPIALQLGWPLRTWSVRKITGVDDPEFAMGAVGPLGVVVWNESEVERLGWSQNMQQRRLEVAWEELERRRVEYGDPPVADIQGQNLIIVDDGIATGFTARAAYESVRRAGAKRIVLAIPVMDAALARSLELNEDELVVLAKVTGLSAVGLWYGDFGQVADDEVLRILSVCRKACVRKPAQTVPN